MAISCDAAIIFAERHADFAEELASKENDIQRKKELLKIAEVCRWVPANAPRNFHEAIQMYWFVHLGTITELNGWDAMNPGHFDQHLTPFYEKELLEGTLNKEEAKELLSCFWIKVNNHPAPPKVGITAKESGTYNDFTNINYWNINISVVGNHSPQTRQKFDFTNTPGVSFNCCLGFDITFGSFI